MPSAALYVTKTKRTVEPSAWHISVCLYLWFVNVFHVFTVRFKCRKLGCAASGNPVSMHRNCDAFHAELVDFAIFSKKFQNVRTVNVESLERIHCNQYTTDVCLRKKISKS